MLGPFLCVLHCGVVSLFSSYIYAFPSGLVCYPDFVFCPWIYEFEQRYTTVAFISPDSIYIVCCTYRTEI